MCQFVDTAAYAVRLRVAGEPWHSILVETGVFKRQAGVNNDPTDPAQFVCKNVEAAVSVIVGAAIGGGNKS
jgi:hypothetical protein